MRLVLLLVLSTGCDTLFRLRHLDDVDAQVVDAPPRDAQMFDARPDVIQTHSMCPAGFALPYENSTYRYIPTAMSWYAAHVYCAGLDDPTSTKRVHLAVLTSDFERQHAYVNVVGSASRFWIGLSDTATDGTYLWVTDEQVPYPTPSAWASGEPSIELDDDCVLSRASTTDLDSLPCSTTSQLVCECDDFADAPANYVLM